MLLILTSNSPALFLRHGTRCPPAKYTISGESTTHYAGFAAVGLILGNYLYPALFRRNLGTLLTLILKFFHQAIVAQFADGGRGRSGLIAEGRPVPAVVAKMPDVAGGDAAVFHQRCVDKKNRSRSSGLVKVGFGGKPIRGADPLISRGISRLPPHPIDRVFRNQPACRENGEHHPNCCSRCRGWWLRRTTSCRHRGRDRRPR